MKRSADRVDVQYAIFSVGFDRKSGTVQVVLIVWIVGTCDEAIFDGIRVDFDILAHIVRLQIRHRI